MALASSSTTSAAAVAPVAEADKKMITLKSADDKVFEVKQNVASESVTIKNIIEEDYAGDVIPLPNVTGSILAKVMEYCKKHAESGDGGEKEEELKAWEKQFMDIDQDVLLDLIMAANYLNVKGLLDLTCQTVADMIKGKTPEQIRQIFHIENDFTDEEEAEIRRENQWAFE